MKANEVFLCHSPMKPHIESLGEKIILITGTGDTNSVMKEYNHSNYLTVEEYVSLFPHMFCHFFVEEMYVINFYKFIYLKIFIIRTEDFKKIRDRVENRLQKSMRDFPVIDAIFMLTDVIRWELNVQLFSDLLISKNGVPGSIRDKDELQAVEFHLCAQDLLYKDTFEIPRIAAGAFWHSLQHIFFLKYKRNIDYKLYGKPATEIFDYASKKNISYIF